MFIDKWTPSCCNQRMFLNFVTNHNKLNASSLTLSAVFFSCRCKNLGGSENVDLNRTVPAPHGGLPGESLSCSQSRGSSLTVHPPLFPTVFHFLCRRRDRGDTHTHTSSLTRLPFCSKRDQNQVPKLTVSRDEAKKKKKSSSRVYLTI